MRGSYIIATIIYTFIAALVHLQYSEHLLHFQLLYNIQLYYRTTVLNKKQSTL